MNLDDVKKRFVDEVKLRALRRQVHRPPARSARSCRSPCNRASASTRPVGALAQVCEAQDYVLESKVLDQLKDILDTSAGNDGRIDEKEFNDAVLNCKKWTKGKKNDVQCKKMVIEMIDETAYKTSQGWFSNWYANVKREIGL